MGYGNGRPSNIDLRMYFSENYKPQFNNYSLITEQTLYQNSVGLLLQKGLFL